MQTTIATQSTPGGVNEDAVVVGEDFAAVIDGATAEPDVDPGCVHGVRWFATRLAGRLAWLLVTDASPKRPLTVILHDAIRSVGRSHRRSCDLTNPCSPSATVALARRRADQLDYLVLGDATVAMEYVGGDVRAVMDDRIRLFDHLPWPHLRQVRNRPGGFWVAGNLPEAAHRAVAGSVPLSCLARVALLSDGAARLVERYGWTWSDLLRVLDTGGPAELIRQTRAAERDTAAGRFSGKHHDDATAVLCRFPAPRNAGALCDPGWSGVDDFEGEVERVEMDE